MAEFRVIKSTVKIFPHPNAEKLELLKIGTFQAVVQKGAYHDGDAVVFAPEKAVLPDAIAQEYRKYLKGPLQNRVGTIRLRGELSMGVIIPVTSIDPDNLLPYNEDIAEKLGIIKYEPPIPQDLAGKVLPVIDFPWLTSHDVEQFRIYAEEFIASEPVRVWEKIHGSQVIYLRNKNGEVAVTSKGLLKRGLMLEEAVGNTYWAAAQNLSIFERLEDLFGDRNVQLFGEVIPVQKGFNYGFSKPHVLFFKIVVDGCILPYEEVPEQIKSHWVPLLYEGIFDPEKIIPLCENLKFETVSGRQLHIAEGGVITPVRSRLSAEGFDLQLKVISKAYAKVEDDEAIS
jgi:RNA ligase (TIGR02306 family)